MDTAWEDRPLNLRRLRQNSSGSSPETAEQLVSSQSEAPGDDEEADTTPMSSWAENAASQWENRPLQPQQQRDSDTEEAKEPARIDANELQLADNDEADRQDDGGADPVTAATESAATWEEAIVSDTSSATGSGQAWDETPVGSSKRGQVVWDEYPPGFESDPQAETSAHTGADCGVVEATAPLPSMEAVVDEDDTNADDDVDAVTETDGPPFASGQSHSAWDETPVGSSRRLQQDWDEYPPGFEQHEQQTDGPSATVETDEEQFADAMMMLDDESTEYNDSNAFEVDEDVTDESVVVVEMPSITWDETPMSGTDPRPSVWDETPVGSGDSVPRRWSEYAAETYESEPQADDAAMGTGCEDEAVMDEPMAEGTAAIETVVERNDTVEVNASAWDETPGCADSNAWDATPVGTSRRQQVWEEYPPDASSASSVAVVDQRLSQDDEKGKMTLADLDGPEEEEPDKPREQDAAPAVSPDVPPASASSFAASADAAGTKDDSTESVIPLIEDNGHAVTMDDMIVDGTGFEVHDGSLSVPMWDESPIKPTARFFQDTSIDRRSGKRFESVDSARDARSDAEPPVAFATKLSARTASTMLVTKTRAPALEHTNGLSDARRSLVGGAPSVGRRSRTPEYSPPKNGSDGLSFLVEFGIRAYLRHKQILITSNDERSQSLFQAVVYGSDPDRILEVLTANEPLCDEWMVYSPSKVRMVSPEPATHSFLDVLYAREPGEALGTPKRTTPSKSEQLQTPPPSSGARKTKIDRLFNRTPVKQRATLTYDLIMNNADVDAILEAEFGSETCELPIFGPYKYPTLSGNTLGAARPSRSPVGGGFGASSLSGSRFLAAPLPVAGASSLASGGNARTGHLLLPEAAPMPVRTTTPPLAAEPTNPLKRAASTITRTPPLPVAKAMSAPSATTEASARPAASSRPSASRFGIRPSSPLTVGVSGTMLRRSSSQPAAAAPAGTTRAPVASAALLRPRSSLTSEPSAGPARASISSSSSLPKALPRPAQSSLLQRKSFLPTPGSGTAALPLGSRRETMAGSIAHATDTSSLQARRTSFGFARPTATGIPKKP